MMTKSHEKISMNEKTLIYEGLNTCHIWKLYDNPFYKEEEEEQCEGNKLRSQIIELKAELVCERRARKRTESISKRLSKELAQERRGMERVCQHLTRELSNSKSEIHRMKKEIEDERKMFRREDRVQMKLSRAKIVFKESKSKDQIPEQAIIASDPDYVSSMAATRRRVSLEAENPHIKRGIKGCVEFSRVVKAIESKTSRHYWGTELECQKAQLKILLEQKSPIRSNTLILSYHQLISTN